MAVYCFVGSLDKWLLMERSGIGCADGMLSVPSGHLDEGEQLTTAASREVFEETGLVVDTKDWVINCVLHRNADTRRYIDVFLSTSKWEGEPYNKEPEKSAWVEFRSVSASKEKFVDYVFKAWGLMQENKGINFFETGFEND